MDSAGVLEHHLRIYLERWEMQGSHPNMPVKVQVTETIDGKVIKGDPRRAVGIRANAAVWVGAPASQKHLHDQ